MAAPRVMAMTMASVVVPLLHLLLYASTAMGQSNPINLITCNNDDVAISCPGGSYIDPVTAVFGRTDPAYAECGEATVDDCVSQNGVIADVETVCKGNIMCNFTVSDAFGDPCAGVRKYLNLTYECLEPLPVGDTAVATACEDAPLVLKCANGGVIEIVSATYGRFESTVDTCGFPESGETNCSLSGAADVLVDECQGLPECRIETISNALFGGDPCIFVKKVAEVEYTCLESTTVPGKTVCENNEAVLSCPAGQTIEVTSATFGRTAMVPACSPGNTNNEMCGRRDNALDFLQDECDGSSSCAVDVTVRFFGFDPCQSVKKYLEYEYECLEGNMPPVEVDPIREIACNNENLTLTCEAGTYIDILTAVYGRTNTSLAVGCGAADVDDCMSEKGDVVKVEDQCNGLESCILGVSDSLFGDPCPRVRKYLNVSYACLEPVGPGMVATATACEGTSLIMKCAPGHEIDINGVNYGRLSSTTETCGYPELTVPMCSLPAAVDVVEKQCQGENSCELAEVGNEVLGGDPCEGVRKVLEVTYNCVLGDGETPEGMTVCENDSVEVSCPEGEVIEVSSALFGRLSVFPLCAPGDVSNTMCGEPDNLISFMAEECGGKSSCSFDATVDTVGFDPCPATKKYVEYEFACVVSTALPPVDPETKTTIVCSNDELDISCPKGAYIDFLMADYGRTSTSLDVGCGGADVDDCVSENGVVVALEAECKGLQSCSLGVSDSLFGDPCEGVRKYLNVSYSCLEPVEPEVSGFATACEGTSLIMKCAPGYVIAIEEFNYGRLPSTTETCGFPTSTTPACSLPDADDVVKDECEGANSCEIPMIGIDIFTNAPCPGVKKVAEASYTCVLGETTPPEGPTVCENEQVEIFCPAGRAIEVTAAFFGRTSSVPNCSPGDMTDTMCGQPDNLLAFMSGQCDAQNACSFDATVATFGFDPCPSTKKYVEYQFECVDKSTTEIVCNTDVAKFSCSEGFIDIVMAEYGSTSTSGVCGMSTVDDCVSENGVLIKVEQECKGESFCMFNVSDSLFGDPCSGVRKYLNASAECVLPLSTGSARKTTACEETPLILQCEAGSQIDILSVNYGRVETTDETCGLPVSSETKCSLAGAGDVIGGLCQGLASCTLPMISNQVMGGDPCPGTKKVAEVTYTCSSDSAPPVGVNVCENKNASISCPAGAVIDVTLATFGRTSPIPNCQPGDVSNTKCGRSDNVLDIVEDLCDGQSACSLPVKVSQFGFDPCPGIKKYLEYEFVCESEEGGPSLKTCEDFFDPDLTVDCFTTRDMENNLDQIATASGTLRVALVSVQGQFRVKLAAIEGDTYIDSAKGGLFIGDQGDLGEDDLPVSLSPDPSGLRVRTMIFDPFLLRSGTSCCGADAYVYVSALVCQGEACSETGVEVRSTEYRCTSPCSGELMPYGGSNQCPVCSS